MGAAKRTDARSCVLGVDTGDFEDIRTHDRASLLVRGFLNLFWLVKTVCDPSDHIIFDIVGYIVAVPGVSNDVIVIA